MQNILRLINHMLAFFRFDDVTAFASDKNTTYDNKNA